MKRFLMSFCALAFFGGAVFLWITRADTLQADTLEGLTADATLGEAVFHASGCASCHTAPGAEASDTPLLAGGQKFPSDFGTFVAPNISPDPKHGIGGWTATDLANAMLRGVSPEGQHYYPAFPYASYIRMQPQDVVNLHAFLATLPASVTPSQPHEVGFPFNIRRSVGGWKWLYLNDNWIMPASTEQLERGRYIVEAMGHCGECHTPRNVLGAMDQSAWLTGAPDPSGKGTIPNITPAELSWSDADLTYYFETGFTPDFDSAGGHMAHVVENLARLTPEDREAVTAYLKALP
ncbi:Fructose dehydrogenase cytochrome subunit precursor [Shimia sp. SK013]|uniref:c-type cytochrome n=1 Tax=Shimia sp. SK013 TaxID=1389006 RepID=UPI0006B5F433|nr:c-type cytochrome [Shimia sp. SK013]KPA22667.1 Fructose dehydrogenase cytochrome subunit precursor [Shimia sp. SK013]